MMNDLQKALQDAIDYISNTGLNPTGYAVLNTCRKALTESMKDIKQPENNINYKITLHGGGGSGGTGKMEETR